MRWTMLALAVAALLVAIWFAPECRPGDKPITIGAMKIGGC